MTSEQATKLLDEVLYARVLECVELSRLFTIELDLWAALCEQTDASEDGARAQAKSMIDRAIARLANTDDRYVALQPFGVDCAECDDEIRRH